MILTFQSSLLGIKSRAVKYAMFSLLPFCGRKEHRQKRHETLEKCQRGSRWLAGRMAGGCRFCPAVWPSPIDLAGAAVPPDRSYRRRSCACVIRVDVALACAAGSRHRALDQRKVGAILIAASPHGDEVHANRKIWIIRLSPGSPCCRDHSCRQNSQGQNTHRNLSRIASKPSEPNNRTVMSIPVNTLSRTSLRKPMARGNSSIARLGRGRGRKPEPEKGEVLQQSLGVALPSFQKFEPVRG